MVTTGDAGWYTDDNIYPYVRIEKKGFLMGRQRSIDRDKVLDTAEEIVATVVPPA